MIEIDDAGIGCPILGEVYAIRRIETNEHLIRYLPIQDMNRNKRNELWTTMLADLNVSIEETVQLCRGPIFNQFANILKDRGYKVERVKISDETNDLAENFFTQKLQEYNIPEVIQSTDRDFGQFHYLIMTWYATLYKGKENLLKPSMEKSMRKWKNSYMHNPIRKFPNLVQRLFDNEI